MPRAEDASDRELLEREVARFARERLAPRIPGLEHPPDDRSPDGAIEELRELDLLELPLPGERGGGGSVADLTAVVEAIARVVAAPACLLLAHALAQRLVVESGDERALDAVVSGRGARWLGYPLYARAGDRDAMPRARDEDGALVLEGELELVVGAPGAERLVVPAVDVGDGSIVLTLVSTRAAGVRIGPALHTLGMRGCPAADVTFERASVGREGRLATCPDAEALVRTVTARLRGPALAIGVGVTASSLQTALAYARDRVQGGRPIVEHPQVRAMLEEMLAARASCHDAAAWLSADDPPPEPEATGAFVRAKERAARACSIGVQVLGGYGYMEDFGQERCLRDAKQAQQLLGRGDPLRQDAMERWLASSA